MELIKENYNANSFWICPMCGKPFYTSEITDTNDNRTALYMDTTCAECGALLTVVCEVSHVCVWKEEE